VLDVGSGLGGIDVLLNRHYLATAGNPLEVALLDGIDDMPEVSFHDRTYNDMAVAIDFWSRTASSIATSCRCRRARQNRSI
jgi:hypothetical protein